MGTSDRIEATAPLGPSDWKSLRGLAGLRVLVLDRGVAGDAEAAMTAFVARQPIGRLGTAEEVAALAVYLAADESGYTSGTTHVIDGGWST